VANPSQSTGGGRGGGPGGGRAAGGQQPRARAAARAPTPVAGGASTRPESDLTTERILTPSGIVRVPPLLPLGHVHAQGGAARRGRRAAPLTVVVRRGLALALRRGRLLGGLVLVLV